MLLSNRELRLHSFPVPAGRGEALLFVHGAYADSRCWTYAFIPFFRRQGYDCFALDLSGHGISGGRRNLHELGIDDYADDVAEALRQIGRPAVLVGHSMGTLVIERYVTRGGDAPAVILLAPVPPTGTGGSAMQLALREPGFFRAIEEAVSGRVSPEVAEMMTRVYFSPQMTPAETLKFLPMLGPESERAIAEMALLQLRPVARRRRPPALVVGGECDAVFPASMLHFTAAAWSARQHRVPGSGHMLMLDPQWEETARHILSWLQTRPGAPLPEQKTEVERLTRPA